MHTKMHTNIYFLMYAGWRASKTDLQVSARPPADDECFETEVCVETYQVCLRALVLLVSNQEVRPGYPNITSLRR